MLIYVYGNAKKKSPPNVNMELINLMYFYGNPPNVNMELINLNILRYFPLKRNQEMEKGCTVLLLLKHWEFCDREILRNSYVQPGICTFVTFNNEEVVLNF